MSKFLVICLFLLLSCIDNKTNKKEVREKAPNNSICTSAACVDFNSLNNKIRDGLISKQEALKKIQTLLPQIKIYFYENGGRNIEKSNWIFPVQGYSSKSIGGSNGSGYITMGYDYFDGNKHGGHPAHDIFIVDNNQDCIDDNTKKLVNVLSITGGIVIATETVWANTSNLRGGKYIWIYEPNSKSFFYYAHNSKIFVEHGDIVNPGDTIATVGRTGLNAFKKRSPTHLHITQLKLDNMDYPKPFDSYNDLITIMAK